MKENSVTVWIALDDADAETGVVEYARGSHLWATREESVLESNFHGGDGADFRASARAVSPDGELDIVACTVPRGHAVLHHQDVWHGSAPNTSAVRARRAMGIHLVRGDVTFREGEPFASAATQHAAATRPADYIYGRYKRHGSLEVPSEAFPITCGARRSAFLDGYTSDVDADS